MRSILKSEDFRNTIVVREFPDNFSASNGIQETVYEPEVKGFSGSTHQIILDGIFIEHRNITHTRPFQIEVQHDFPFFKMHFELDGYSGYESQSKGSHNVIINSGCHQLFFFPEVKGKLSYAAQNRYTLEINLTIPYLKKIAGEDLALLTSLATGILTTRPVLMSENCMPILPTMRKVIYEIIQCPYHSIFKKVYLETKVTELLLLQLEQFSQAQKTGTKSLLRKDDIEKIYYVQEIIEKNIQEPCSLLELAEKAGLNDFKLKKGFKEIVGTTVFGYMTDVRMEKARSLLIEGAHSIADISFMIGYKNPQHFTAAFKRKFGYLPSYLKK